MAKEHGITGNWRGHYTYRDDPDDGSNFDAILVENNGDLKGNIRDEGILGEAVVSGTFTYPQVTFVKTYYTPGMDPVHYTGTMDGDGKTISGRWQILARAGRPGRNGTWMAHRTDQEEKKKEKTEEGQSADMETVT